ncbi:MAG: quinolinate synthase NadA, partial [Prevotella sp.]|nr:quinolinate synthase NadA [Prevotella sp.]
GNVNDTASPTIRGYATTIREQARYDNDLAKGSCSCNECQYMKLNTLEKLRNCLRDESPVVDVDPAIAKDAVKPINRMLELS